MTRFTEFVHSPYHNKHKKVRALVTHLSTIYPDFTEKTCHRESLFQFLHPGQKHDQQKLALLFTYALRLAEQFLVQEQFQKEQGLQPIFLLQNLRNKEQNKQYEKVLRTQQKWLDKSTFRDGEHFNYRFQTAAEADLYYTQQGRYGREDSIQRKQDALDQYFLAEKLKDACEMQERSRIIKQQYQNPLLEAILGEVQRNFNKYEAVPPVLVYFHLFQMIRHNEIPDYHQALEVVRRNLGFFPKPEQQNLYNYLQNFCIQQINKGNRPFIKEIFQLYKFQLEEELLFINQFLPEWHYKNIVSTGLLLRETEWVKRFIEDYKGKLAPEVYESAYSYNLAFYYYETGQYDKVLDLLVQLEYTDVRYALNARLLLLKTYYDLDEYEALLSLSDAFRQFLQRQKGISDFNRKGYYNLLKFTRKACQIKMKLGFIKAHKLKQDFQKLRREMSESDIRFSQAWLDEKVEELGQAVGMK